MGLQAYIERRHLSDGDTEIRQEYALNEGREKLSEGDTEVDKKRF